MTAQQVLKITSSIDLRSHCYTSASWLSYFHGNRRAAADLQVPDKIDLPAGLHESLVASLQRFQVGESGDGQFLKKYAATANDPVYEQCIDLFVKEAQGHAGMLAQIIKSMDGSLLKDHWSASAFVTLRRMFGLKTEVFVLLIAEIIGKTFYKTLADRIDNKTLKDAFSLLVIDEIFHLEFHCSFMQGQTKEFSALARKAVYYLWFALFYAASLVFILDHGRVFKAINVSRKAFLEDCTNTFKRTATKVLAAE